jgi:phosphotriesterase-related protein
MATNAGRIMTVRGPVDPGELGFTLAHEHVFLQMWDIAARFDYPIMLDDDEVMLEELVGGRNAGVTTLVELTLPDIGRSPARLRTMSERSGLHIVMGSGWYREPYYRDRERIERSSVGDLADGLLREISDGADGTGIRPGVIGEIGVHRNWVTPIEERVHRAAARAQVASGLSLITHSPMSRVGLDQLTILEAEGVDPGRVAIGHSDSYPHLDYHREILRRGAWVLFDNLVSGTPRYEDRRAALIRDLVERGYQDRLMLSQDVCTDPQLCFNGGPGYAGVPTVFLPRLRDLGVPEASITAMTVANPARFLAIR